MVMKQRLQICLNSMVDTYLTLRKGIGTCGTFGSHMAWVLRYPSTFSFAKDNQS